jgi:hypothetical protein
MNALVEHVTQTVPKAKLIVVFSHTHSAGLMNLDRVHLPGGDLIPAYLSQLAAKVAELTREALNNAQPATIVYGYGRCSLAAHRDFWDDERGEFVCGFNPNEPADDTTGEGGRLLASIINYACHPTTLAWQNTLISPDFPGAMRETIEQATGAPCLFLQGASGELGPREGFVGEVETADRNGRQLGFAALAAVTALPPPQTKFEYCGPVVSGATLGTWKHMPLPPPEVARLKTSFDCQRFTVELPYRTDLASHDQTQAERAAWEAKEQAARAAGQLQEASDCRAMVERCTRARRFVSFRRGTVANRRRAVGGGRGGAVQLSAARIAIALSANADRGLRPQRRLAAFLFAHQGNLRARHLSGVDCNARAREFGEICVKNQ